MGSHSPYIIAFNELLRNFHDYSLENWISSDTNEDLSPLSGAEPKYEPLKWNNEKIQYNHNCFAYVLATIAPKRKGKPQPGYYSNFPPLKKEDYQCENFYQRLKKDIPAMYLTTFSEKCRNGFYKGFIAIDNKDTEQDYHFYRQDDNGYWSHKPGRQKAVNYDADERIIKNPLKANRKYKYFNYTKPCFFFCLNNNISRSSSTSSFDKN